MIKNDLLKNYLADRLKSIEKQVLAYNKNLDPERLHRLRVEIKKTKALFSFIENTFKQKNNTKKLKSLFHQAGDLRELQINIHLLTKVPQFGEKMLLRLKKKENTLKQGFIKNIPKHRKSLSNFLKGLSVPAELPGEEEIKKYFKEKISKANNKLGNNDRNQMHRFRIRIKELMYIYNFLPDEIKKSVQLDKTYIDKLQRKAGNWHDTYAAIDFFSQQRFSQNKSEYLLKLKQKEKRQFNNLLKYKKTQEKEVI